jgi:hypothetical protein
MVSNLAECACHVLNTNQHLPDVNVITLIIEERLPFLFLVALHLLLAVHPHSTLFVVNQRNLQSRIHLPQNSRLDPYPCVLDLVVYLLPSTPLFLDLGLHTLQFCPLLWYKYPGAELA